MALTPLVTQPMSKLAPEAQPTTSLAPMSSVRSATSPRRLCWRRKRSAAAICEPPGGLQPSSSESGLPCPVRKLPVVSPPQPSLTSFRRGMLARSIAYSWSA